MCITTEWLVLFLSFHIKPISFKLLCLYLRFFWSLVVLFYGCFISLFSKRQEKTYRNSTQKTEVWARHNSSTVGTELRCSGIVHSQAYLKLMSIGEFTRTNHRKVDLTFIYQRPMYIFGETVYEVHRTDKISHDIYKLSWFFSDIVKPQMWFYCKLFVNLKIWCIPAWN